MWFNVNENPQKEFFKIFIADMIISVILFER